MTSHRQQMHGTDTEIDWNQLPVSQTEQIPKVSDVSFPEGTSQCKLPFSGRPGSSRTWNGLRNYLNRQHCWDSLRILEDQPTLFPKCKKCGSQVPYWRLSNRQYESDKCRLGEERRSRRTVPKHCFKARWVLISVNSEPLDLVASFLYLGRTVA